MASVPQINLHEMFWVSGLLLLAFWVLFSTVSAIISTHARLKGRTWASFYFISLLVSPFVSGTIVASLASTTHPDEHVVCPSCAERIPFGARVCSHCPQKLTPNQEIGSDITQGMTKVNVRLFKAGIVVSAVGLLAVLVFAFQSETNLAQNLSAAFASWFVLAVGASLFALIPTRRRLITELTDLQEVN